MSEPNKYRLKAYQVIERWCDLQGVKYDEYFRSGERSRLESAIRNALAEATRDAMEQAAKFVEGPHANCPVHYEGFLHCGTGPGLQGDCNLRRELAKAIRKELP